MIAPWRVPLGPRSAMPQMVTLLPKLLAKVQVNAPDGGLLRVLPEPAYRRAPRPRMHLTRAGQQAIRRTDAISGSVLSETVRGRLTLPAGETPTAAPASTAATRTVTDGMVAGHAVLDGRERRERMLRASAGLEVGGRAQPP